MKIKYCIPYYGVHIAFTENELSIEEFAILGLVNFNVSTITILFILNLL